MCKRCRFHIVMNGIQPNRASRLLFQIFIARPRIPQRALLVFSRQPPPGGKICPGWIALQCKLNANTKKQKLKIQVSLPTGVKFLGMKCNAIGWDVHCTTQSTFLYWPICTNREHFLADQFLSRAICPRSAGGFLLVGFSSQKLQNCKIAKQLVEIT